MERYGAIESVLRAEIVEHEQANDDLQRALDAERERVRFLEKQNNNLLDSHNMICQIKSDLDKQLATLQARVKAVELENYAKDGQIETLQAELDDAIKRSSSYLVEKNALRKDLEVEKGFTNRYIKRLHGAEKDLATLRQLREALERIARYGKDGICPYGCDTPHIAKAALTPAAGGTRHG